MNADIKKYHLIAAVLIFVVLPVMFLNLGDFPRRSLFRDKLIMSYKTWKRFHGILSILFITTASWHAIELGRHTNKIISIYIILMALTGSIILIKQYALTFNNTLGAKK